MALLAPARLRLLLAITWPALLLSCSAGENGRATVVIFDRPVVCVGSDAVQCALPDGAPVTGELLEQQAFVSRSASQLGSAQGIYLFFEVTRPSGAVVTLELDAPTTASSPFAPIVSYREVLSGRTVFSSARATGRLELPSESCPCQGGRLELLFTDAGPDGVPASSDDQVRLIHTGVFRPERERCLEAKGLGLGDTLVVAPICASSESVPVGAGSSSSGHTRSGGGSYGGSAEVGCYADPSDAEYEDYEGGCEGEAAESDYEAPGCDPSSSSASGWDSGSGGCEGDTDSSSAACDSDAYAAAAVTRSPHRGHSRAQGMLLPFALLGLFNAYLKRRGRKIKPASTPREVP